MCRIRSRIRGSTSTGKPPNDPARLVPFARSLHGPDCRRVTMAALYGVVFLQSLYFQQERGASALETGLLFLPMTGLLPS